MFWLKLRFGLTPTELARLLPLSRASIHRYRRGFRPGVLVRRILGIPPWNRSPTDLEALVRRVKRENPMPLSIDVDIAFVK